MTEQSEVEAALACLVDAVVSSVDHNPEVAQDVVPIGGYLWKYPSEGSNRVEISSKTLPPPAPQIREYPRKCDQCSACWVSDCEFELDHLRRCSGIMHVNDQDDIVQKMANLGVARRVWCEVDGSFSRLQWRHDRDLDSGDNVSCATNFIEFIDITDISVLDEPANSFQIVTRGNRTVVFQWRREQEEVETTNELVPYRLELDSHQWQEYLNELSKYARHSPLDEPTTQVARLASEELNDKSIAEVFKEISHLLLSEHNADSTRSVLESRLHSVLEKYRGESQCFCDDDGNSLVHLAISLNLGDRTAPVVSTLLDMGVDCNAQNQEGESPLLLVAASGDVATANVLLASPSIQIDLPCALGVRAFHVAANAGDVKMMQILCDAGAQPDIRDDNDWTAMHYAAACSTGLEALHFLCEMLTDECIDTQCSEGNTALHVAAGCGCLDNVRTLLETAASPHICNFGGESAYHLALRNNHIQCAVVINDYQSLPPIRYTEPSSFTEKANAVSEAAAVVPNEWKTARGEAGEWVEAFTEDNYAYYYNTVTGESSWYKPGQYELRDTWEDTQYEERNSSIYNEKTSDNDTSYSYSLAADHNVGSILGDNAGHQLPLCLIPMVSPLTSLDNPTAAAKYEAARRRARKQRKRRQSKLHLIHGHEGAMLPNDRMNRQNSITFALMLHPSNCTANDHRPRLHLYLQFYDFAVPFPKFKWMENEINASIHLLPQITREWITYAVEDRRKNGTR